MRLALSGIGLCAIAVFVLALILVAINPREGEE
jgi:hypothetical protein